MTGLEHYRQAEHQLATAERSANDPAGPLAAAQVHALLALAAAMVLTDPMSRTSAATWLARADAAAVSREGR